MHVGVKAVQALGAIERDGGDPLLDGKEDAVL
jgi:hypothetical protein